MEASYLETAKSLAGDEEKIKKFGNNLLHESARHGYVSVLKCLLELGLDINCGCRHDRNITPLQIACCESNIEAVRFLLENGADINTDSHRHNTILYTVANGNIETLKVLLEYGIDINSSSFNGCTPLYMAAFYGRMDMVKFMLEYGVDPHVESSNGLKPVDMALNTEIKDVLLKAMKKEDIWNMWAMETEAFDSLIQWMPREMTEDVLSLVCQW